MLCAELHPLMGNIFLGTKEQAADRNFMAVQNVQVVASCNLRARRAQIIRGTWNFVHFFIRMAGVASKLLTPTLGWKI